MTSAKNDDIDCLLNAATPAAAGDGGGGPCFGGGGSDSVIAVSLRSRPASAPNSRSNTSVPAAAAVRASGPALTLCSEGAAESGGGGGGGLERRGILAFAPALPLALALEWAVGSETALAVAIALKLGALVRLLLPCVLLCALL